MRRTILVALALLTVPAWSAEVWHTSRVAIIYPLADGPVGIMFHDDAASCTNTGSPKRHYLVVGQNSVTADGFERIYAAVLTALATGKSISIAFDDTTSSCYINRAMLHDS